MTAPKWALEIVIAFGAVVFFVSLIGLIGTYKSPAYIVHETCNFWYVLTCVYPYHHVSFPPVPSVLCLFIPLLAPPLFLLSPSHLTNKSTSPSPPPSPP